MNEDQMKLLRGQVIELTHEVQEMREELKELKTPRLVPDPPPLEPSESENQGGQERQKDQEDQEEEPSQPSDSEHIKVLESGNYEMVAHTINVSEETACLMTEDEWCCLITEHMLIDQNLGDLESSGGDKGDPERFKVRHFADIGKVLRRRATVKSLRADYSRVRIKRCGKYATIYPGGIVNFGEIIDQLNLEEALPCKDPWGNREYTPDKTVDLEVVPYTWNSISWESH